MNEKEEIYCKGLNVTFIKTIEDVTTKVNKNIKSNFSEKQKDSTIQINCKLLEEIAESGNHYEAFIRPFFMVTNIIYLLPKFLKIFDWLAPLQKVLGNLEEKQITGFGRAIMQTLVCLEFIRIKIINPQNIVQIIYPTSPFTLFLFL